MKLPYAHMCTDYIHVHRMQLYIFIQEPFLPFSPHEILYVNSKTCKAPGCLIYKNVHIPSITGSQMTISTLVLGKTMSTEVWGLICLLLGFFGFKMQINSLQVYQRFRTDESNYSKLNF